MATTTPTQQSETAASVQLDWQQRQTIRGLALLAVCGVLLYATTSAFMLLAWLSPYASDPSFATSIYIDYVRFGYFIFFGLAALGLGILALAATLSRALSSAALTRAGLYLLCVVGICYLCSALFPDDAPGSPLSAAGTFHAAATLTAMLCIAIAPLLFARAFHRDPLWRGHTVVSFAFGVLALAALAGAIVALGLPTAATSLGIFSVAAAPFAALTLLWLLLTAFYVRRVILA